MPENKEEYIEIQGIGVSAEDYVRSDRINNMKKSVAENKSYAYYRVEIEVHLEKIREYVSGKPYLQYEQAEEIKIISKQQDKEMGILERLQRGVRTDNIGRSYRELAGMCELVQKEVIDEATRVYKTQEQKNKAQKEAIMIQKYIEENPIPQEEVNKRVVEMYRNLKLKRGSKVEKNNRESSRSREVSTALNK